MAWPRRPLGQARRAAAPGSTLLLPLLRRAIPTHGEVGPFPLSPSPIWFSFLLSELVIGIRVWTVLLSLVFFSSSLLVLGLNRFGMGIRSRVRVLLFF